jgi:hypothetical protein
MTKQIVLGELIEAIAERLAQSSPDKIERIANEVLPHSIHFKYVHKKLGLIFEEEIHL